MRVAPASAYTTASRSEFTVREHAGFLKLQPLTRKAEEP